MTDLFSAGDRVDITIPGAEVVDHGATTITFTIPGVPDRTFCLPTRDGRAREVIEVTPVVDVPCPVAGEVYLVAGAADHRLFAFNHGSGDGVALLDPIGSKSYWPENAVARFGPLHLSIPMPQPDAHPAAPVPADQVS